MVKRVVTYESEIDPWSDTYINQSIAALRQGMFMLSHTDGLYLDKNDHTKNKEFIDRLLGHANRIHELLFKVYMEEEGKEQLSRSES